MSVIRWENPPPHSSTGTKRRSAYDDAAQQLKGRPGEWALIAEMKTGTAGSLSSRLRRGGHGFAPSGHFESLVRKVDDATSRVYARYVGEVPDAG